jgi:TonB family protein
MIRKSYQCVGIVLLLCGICAAQRGNVSLPDSLVITRDTFWDFGPPFSYYDLIQIKNGSQGLALDQVLVTPHGEACMQPATVEERTVTLHRTMADLLQGRNPCAISERELHRELKRCKKCRGFSGVYVMMDASCGGTERILRMDILDRDIYDLRTQTPSNTSWTMSLLSQLNDVLGPGSEEKPIFQTEPAKPQKVPDTDLVRAIGDGKFDDLFGAREGVSQIVREAGQAHPTAPSVEIESVAPIGPLSPKMPVYPQITILARMEGVVNVTFEISAQGKPHNIVVVDGPPMLQQSVIDGLSGWSFPQSAWGSSGRAAIRFRRNCTAGPSEPAGSFAPAPGW